MFNRPNENESTERSQDVLWLRDHSGDVAGGACTPVAEPAQPFTAEAH